MKTLAILSGKGGAGKTTLAVHLAVAAEQAGHSTAVIDLDPQASAFSWKSTRVADKETPVVISAHSARLLEILDTARDEGVDLTIIDTAPHAETPALAAARAASLVLIPCRPAIFDLRSIKTTIDITRLAQVPSMVVLNAVPARGKRTAEARRAIATYNVPCAPFELGNRVAFVSAVTSGQTAQETDPRGKASQEVLSLYTHITKHIGVLSNGKE
ncbi:AAA family ATPase [Candidatus Poribacteria bacterium]|nr:AAA family ATPase [Candidatus Poribacteria bacterium]